MDPEIHQWALQWPKYKLSFQNIHLGTTEIVTLTTLNLTHFKVKKHLKNRPSVVYKKDSLDLGHCTI